MVLLRLDEKAEVLRRRELPPRRERALAQRPGVRTIKTDSLLAHSSCRSVHTDTDTPEQLVDGVVHALDPRVHAQTLRRVQQLHGVLCRHVDVDLAELHVVQLELAVLADFEDALRLRVRPSSARSVLEPHLAAPAQAFAASAGVGVRSVRVFVRVDERHHAVLPEVVHFFHQFQELVLVCVRRNQQIFVRLVESRTRAAALRASGQVRALIHESGRVLRVQRLAPLGLELQQPLLLVSPRTPADAHAVAHTRVAARAPDVLLRIQIDNASHRFASTCFFSVASASTLTRTRARTRSGSRPRPAAAPADP